MKNIIIHIPHSSLKIPKIFYKKALLSKAEILNENLMLCDLYTDKFLNNKKCYEVRVKFSRLFCDVEKFKDESKEKMAKFGMGAIYTRNSNGNKLINADDMYKEKVLSKYYDSHHNKMDNLITKILKKKKECYIIDLHSFSDYQAQKMFNVLDYPDICIGIDDEFADPILNNIILSFLNKCGYDIKINYPYSGSFVPNIAYQNKYKNVKSVMIEINKRLYINNDFTINKQKFVALKSDLNVLLDNIIKYVNHLWCKIVDKFCAVLILWLSCNNFKISFIIFLFINFIALYDVLLLNTQHPKKGFSMFN